jgi:hypothetical protein
MQRRDRLSLGRATAWLEMPIRRPESSGVAAEGSAAEQSSSSTSQ